MKKVDAIFCGDLHLRDNVPVARVDDDYFAAMWSKFMFIDSLGLEHNCPILCSGDFFDKWKVSPELLSSTIDAISADWYTIYGDHDLPSHSFKLRHKSGLTTLSKTGKIKIIPGAHGVDKSSDKLPNKVKSFTIAGRKILVWHVLTWHKELPYPGCDLSDAKSLLKLHSKYDCILTGDNHTTFVVKHKGRILVNPGSMMRNRADQDTHKPVVWLYSADDNSVQPMYLPIDSDVISREHIEIKNERNERIEAYVSKLKSGFKLSMSFKENVIQFFSKNKTKKKIRKIILENIEEHEKS